MIGQIKHDIKNLIGWRTPRKLVVFSVDDYGNIRIDSKQAREALDKAGFKCHNRFDQFDTLETTEDLDALFAVLSSVQDTHGNHAVFTPFSVPHNINFEALKENNYTQFIGEDLVQTYQKKEAISPKDYQGTWLLWKEGIKNGLLAPEFHGREHLHIKVLEEKMKQRDKEVLLALENRSYTGLDNSGYSTISNLAAFDFWDMSENNTFPEIITSGIAAFKQVFGLNPTCFTPPSYHIHPMHYSSLYKEGIRFVDGAGMQRIHLGHGNYKKSFNYTGKLHTSGIKSVVRNVVFEPTEERGIDWVNLAMIQIEAAFRWNRPAIISSHRVNFCGLLDEKNREKGLESLAKLLHAILKRWPDVEFISAGKLGKIIGSKEK
jgi:hypothetical protein